MQYKNGRRAKNGDVASFVDKAGNVVTGTVSGVSPNTNTCIITTTTKAIVAECLHVDDLENKKENSDASV